MKLVPCGKLHPAHLGNYDNCLNYWSPLETLQREMNDGYWGHDFTPVSGWLILIKSCLDLGDSRGRGGARQSHLGSQTPAAASQPMDNGAQFPTGFRSRCTCFHALLREPRLPRPGRCPRHTAQLSLMRSLHSHLCWSQLGWRWERSFPSVFSPE